MRVKDYLNTSFCFTYGDGVGNVNIEALIEHYIQTGKQATITAVQPPGGYGALNLKGTLVDHFKEKPEGDGGWINGGFFILEPSALDLIDSDRCSWEIGPLQKLAETKQLNAYFHDGFWQPMGTIRAHQKLDELWASGAAPWKNWP